MYHHVPSASDKEGFQPSYPSLLAEMVPSPGMLQSQTLNYSASTQHGLLLSLQNSQTRRKQAR